MIKNDHALQATYQGKPIPKFYFKLHTGLLNGRIK